MRLRPYQQDIFEQLISSCTNDLVQLDTGAGKTPIEAALAKHYPYVMLLAHRNILITQMSEKLASFGIEHDTVSTEYVRRRSILTHLKNGHKKHIDKGHKAKLAVSIDSLIARYKKGLLHYDLAAEWVIVIDEAHHVLPDNKWGFLQHIFPNARFIGFTGTPARYDGESLSVKHGGLFDKLVQSDELKTDSINKLISKGYLADFEAYCPADAKKLNTYNNADELSLACDPIAYYKKHLAGRRTVMFCPSIKNAEEFAEQFRAEGVRSACISSAQSSSDTAYIIDAFTERRIDVLTNVDMVSEGFDMPSIDALILAKRTGSFIMYRQWCGRVLRPCDSKTKAIIVDLAGNVEVHGMPDAPLVWDIETPPKGLDSLRHIPCERCFRCYPVSSLACPECGLPNPFLTGKSIGSYYLTIRKRLDWAMIHYERERYRQALKAHEDEEKERVLSAEIIPLNLNTSPSDSSVDFAIKRLKKWCIQALSDNNISTREINRFISSREFETKDFWTKHFTINDIDKAAKAVKVFKKWQKSR